MNENPDADKSNDIENNDFKKMYYLACTQSTEL